jgi:hypothetical protein
VFIARLPTEHVSTESRPTKGSPLASWSLAIPCVSLLMAFFFVLGTSSGTGGDMVGWAYFVIAGIGLGGGGLAGIALMIASLLRKESGFGRQLTGLLLNFLCLIAGAMSAQVWLHR